MPILLIGICVVAAFLSSGTGLFPVAVLVAVLSFFSNGVLANFGGDPEGAPDWAATVSLLTTLAGVAMLIAALVIK